MIRRFKSWPSTASFKIKRLLVLEIPIPEEDVKKIIHPSGVTYL